MQLNIKNISILTADKCYGYGVILPLFQMAWLRITGLNVNNGRMTINRACRANTFMTLKKIKQRIDGA